MKGKKQNDRSRHFLAAFRHDDFTGLGPRESDLRRRRTDKVERNKCDKPKRDSVVAASRRYLKVNVLWRTAANRSNTSCTHAFLINQLLFPSPSPFQPVSLHLEETSMPKSATSFFSRLLFSPFFHFLLSPSSWIPSSRGFSKCERARRGWGIQVFSAKPGKEKEYNRSDDKSLTGREEFYGGFFLFFS